MRLRCPRRAENEKSRFARAGIGIDAILLLLFG
jgi:hypothetical protein